MASDRNERKALACEGFACKGCFVKKGLGRLLLLSGGFAVFAAEALDAAGGVNQFLLAGEERVARRANFYADVAFVRGTRGKGAAARAMHADFMVRRMDSCLHWISQICVLNHLILKDTHRIQQPGEGVGAWIATPGGVDRKAASFEHFPASHSLGSGRSLQTWLCNYSREKRSHTYAGTHCSRAQELASTLC